VKLPHEFGSGVFPLFDRRAILISHGSPAPARNVTGQGRVIEVYRIAQRHCHDAGRGQTPAIRRRTVSCVGRASLVA
jgi:hypothetical protein